MTRYEQLLNNTLDFDSAAQTRLIRSPLPYWTKRICWTEEEARLRSLDLQYAKAHVLNALYPKAERAIRLWTSADRPPALSSVLKLGKQAHIEPMIRTGVVRVMPASYYADSSLNPQIQDNELSATIYMPAGTTISFSEKPDGPYQEISGLHGPLRAHAPCDNFYVFCAAGLFEPRLFDSFDADSCLLIKDWQRFAHALDLAVRAQIGVASTISRSVYYMDPCHSGSNFDVDFTKHFRYEHQKEWRMVWRVDGLANDAAGLFVELGSLADYCELLAL